MSNHRTVFAPRPTKCINRWEVKNWNLKVYAITANTEISLDSAIVEAAERTANTMALPESGGYGFATIHRGDENVWLLLDVWVDDILHHYLFSSPLESPTKFEKRTGDATFACVWELSVVAHERTAWVNHVMRSGEPDYDAYMNDHWASE